MEDLSDMRRAEKPTRYPKLVEFTQFEPQGYLEILNKSLVHNYNFCDFRSFAIL
jgi:hypothetical protein